MAGTVEVVEFTLGSESYALDIRLVREIVDLMPITPIPRAPSHITGVINLRGEITNIMNLKTLLGIAESGTPAKHKIIVFMPESAGGNNVGITVDTVRSVTTVREDQIERSDASSAGGQIQYIKGIIKLGSNEAGSAEKRLVLWLDLEKVLADVAKK